MFSSSFTFPHSVIYFRFSPFLQFSKFWKEGHTLPFAVSIFWSTGCLKDNWSSILHNLAALRYFLSLNLNMRFLGVVQNDILSLKSKFDCGETIVRHTCWISNWKCHTYINYIAYIIVWGLMMVAPKRCRFYQFW